MNRRVTNYSLDKGLIEPAPRKVMRVFGVIISIYAIAVFAIDDSVSFFWGVMLAAFGLFPLFIYTKRKLRYYSPLIFTMFYFLGYLLSGANVLLNKAEIPRTGYGAIGNFMFTDADFLTLSFVIIAGMSGIMTATFIAEKIFGYRRRIGPLTKSEYYFLPKKKLHLWIWVWVFFSIFLMLLMWHFEIGRTGMRGKTPLPFKLVGLFFYLKGIFVPVCGILLLDICLQGIRRRLASLVLILLIVIGILSSLSGTSKGGVAFIVFPAILFLFFTSHRSNLSQKLLPWFSVVALVIAFIVVFIVSAVRRFAYANLSWNFVDAINVLTSLNDVDLHYSFYIFISTMTDRVGGIRELMAVIGSNISDIEYPIKVFMGMVNDEYHRYLSYSVFGFIVPEGEGIAFGLTYGMWGRLFLSKSYFVVYIGTVFLVGILICFEEIFLRKGLYSVALMFSIIICFQFWGGVTLLRLSRFLVLLLICYFTALYVLKKMRKTSPRGVRA